MDSKEQKTEQSPIVTTVTRAKHPGRVAQGKKLSALMKVRKEALVKNKDSEVDNSTYQVPVSSTCQVLASHAGSAMTSFGLYDGLVILLAGGIYYLCTHSKARAMTLKWMI